MLATNRSNAISITRERRGRNPRLPALLVTAVASVLSIAGASEAHASLAVGGELAMPFAVEGDSRASGPSLVGEAALRWWLDDIPVGLGVSVGERRDSFISVLDAVSPESSELRTLLVGGTVVYQLGQPRWSVRPFVGAGLGYARLTLDSTADRRQYASGVFVSPQAGLRVPLGRVELTAGARYHHVYTGYTIETVDDKRRRHFGGIGLGLGLFARI
jgi:hypothetical protein